MEIDIASALSFGWPGALWRLTNNDYAGLFWVSENIPKPTMDEIIIAHHKYQIEKKKTAYIDRRKTAYPSIENQLDMIYWDKINGTDLWMDSITNIKAAHAKGE